MAELKPGWRLVKFGDVVRLNRDRCANPLDEGVERYVGLEHIEPDDLRIRRWGLVAEGTTFTNLFCPGQVLFGKRRAYQRKVAVADFEGVCSGDIYVFESKDPGVLLPELLPFICQTDSFFDHAVGTSAGSLSPRTNWTQLAHYEFALPPLDEQRRMAELLWMHQRLCEEYHAAKEAAETLVASYTEAFLASYKGEPSSVDALLLEPPKNGISPKTNGQEAGYRTVSLSAIVDGKFLPEGNEKYADVDYERVLPFFVQAGDVFVVRGNGNRELTGKCGIAFQNYDDMFYPDLLIRLRFDPSKILPEFAVLQWNCASVHNRLISRAKSTNGIWKVNGADIRSHELTVPPLDEQREFLASVGEVQCASQQLAQRQMLVEAMAKLSLG